MLRPARAGKAPKAPPLPKPAQALRDGEFIGAAADALLSRRTHSARDYAWLAVTLAGIAAAVVFWPVWDQLIGSEEKDYFTILGVERNADSGVVKRAYRNLARQWHPDHNPGCGDECREKMRTIQQAYKAVSENPEAVPEKEEDGGFNATLLHLFLGRLFEMVFFFAEFVVCLVPTVGFTQWNGYRGMFLLGGSIALHLYLVAVRVPLSWVGIAVCLYKFKKLADWAPAIRAAQQLAHFFMFVLPATVFYVCSVYWYQRGMSWYQLSLNLTVGIMYLTGFIIRSRLQIISTYHIKRVPHLPFRLVLSLLWDYGCTDLLCYVIKVPNPFRIAAHCLVLIALWQRWIYLHVDRTRLNEFGRIIGVQQAEAQQYPGFLPEPPRPSEDGGAEKGKSGPPEFGPPRAALTEPKNETKEERMARQRSDRPNTSRGLWCLVLGIMALFLALGAAGFAYEKYTADPATAVQPPVAPDPNEPPFRAQSAKSAGAKPKAKAKAADGAGKAKGAKAAGGGGAKAGGGARGTGRAK